MANAEIDLSNLPGWIAGPTRFLDTKYGRVRALFQHDRVFVTVASEQGQAHINDNHPALVYRGEDYIGSVAFVLGASGWEVQGKPHFSRRSNWSDAPRTYADAMAEAIRVEVEAFACSNPDVLDAGERAEVAQDLTRIADRYGKAKRAYLEAEAEMRDLLTHWAEIDRPELRSL